MTNACKTNRALRFVFTRPSNTLQSDYCDIHRLISLHFLYSCAVQSIFLEPIGRYMRWGYIVMFAVLYDDENSKPFRTPDLAVLTKE
jgi:hypothetical protein